VACDAIGLPVGAAFAAAAAVRRGKAVHPHGVTYAARLTVTGATAAPRGAQLLRTPAEHDAIVRFSRSLGLPRPLPDLLGVSVRVLDAYGSGRHQDLLAVTSVGLPGLHQVFVPATDVQQRPYTTALPYRAGSERFVIGVVPHPMSPRPGGDDEFERLARAAATGRLRYNLAVTPLLGRFRPVGTLSIGARLPDELDALRFDPWNSGGGLEPVGLLNRLRDYAYTMSQAGWRTTQRDGARRQAAAEDALARVRSGAPPPAPRPRAAGRVGDGRER
jgi:hypothetical protein